MENKILPLPSGNSGINFVAERSRKRKLTDADEWGTVSENNLGYGFSKKSCILHKMNSLSGINEQQNPHAFVGDSKAQAVESVASRHQFVKNQFHTRNGILDNTKSYRTGTQKVYDVSKNMLTESLHCGGSLFLNKMLNRKALTVSNGPSQPYNLSCENERLVLPCILEFSGTQPVKQENGPSLQDLRSFGHKNHVLNNQSMEVQNSSPESLRPSKLLHQSFIDRDELTVDLEGEASMLETGNSRSSSDLKQDDQNLNTAESSAATASLQLCAHIEVAENDRSWRSKTAVVRDDQSHGDGSIQTKDETKGSHSNSSLEERFSPKNGGNLTNLVGRDDFRSNNSYSSSKLLDEKTILIAGKSASTIPEKLWDGSLQLNSSVSVSAVAFFKSGEKMPAVKWSELIEVKGKVRLEAFERYIKDLTRSRNRGLMVISLCWKEGSSKSGLVGMKKVAKSYKEGKRVGFVQLSPGIDLYICPCSDSIITILAKHGFFKGMAAVVDNQDSLIGCVVWRRNGASTNSASKKSDGKNCSSSKRPLKSSLGSKNCSSSKQPLKSSLGSKNCSSSDISEQPINASSGSKNCSSSEQPLNSLYSAQPTQDPIPVASETKSTAFESAGKSRNEGKLQKTSEGQLHLHNSSASANLSPISSVPSPKTFSHSNCTIHSASLQGSMAQSSQVETPLIHKSIIEKAELSLEVQKPLLSLPFEVTRQPTPALDDDDLPEFDFGTASGISHPMSIPLDAMRMDKKLLTEELKKLDGSLQPFMSTIRSLSAFNQPRLEILTSPRLPLDAVQRMPVKKVYEHKEKQNQRSRATMISLSATSSKNLFNDDEDMPEWCPPNAELRLLSVPPQNASTISVPIEAPSSGFKNFSSCYSSPVAVHYLPPFTQAFPYGNRCSIDVTMKPVQQPRSAYSFVQKGPNSTIPFNAKPPLRPPLNTSSIKHFVQPAGWRGWRP